MGHAFVGRTFRPPVRLFIRVRAAARSTYPQARSACRSEHFMSTNVVFRPIQLPASTPAASSANLTLHPPAQPVSKYTCPKPPPHPKSVPAGGQTIPLHPSIYCRTLSTGSPGSLNWLAPLPLLDLSHASKEGPSALRQPLFISTTCACARPHSALTRPANSTTRPLCPPPHSPFALFPDRPVVTQHSTYAVSQGTNAGSL